MRVLVVEDDAVIADHITACLGTLGYRPERVASGEDALAAVERQRFSGMVLDRLLPGMSGIEVLARLRADRRLPPVVMLSALGTVKDRIEGLAAGADDYLAKPFQMGELLARVRGLVRRVAGRTSPVIQAGRLALDTRRMSATLDGAPLKLSPLEFRLLDCLAHNPGRAVSAGELAEQLYGVADTADANAIEALVTRLRRKVGAEVIETRRGFGYLLTGLDS